MSCSFDLGHYREVLEAAKAGGYRFASFERDPRPGDVLVRHDVDLSLDAAVRMAELEAELGVAATYLLMTESVFYNLSSREGTHVLARLLGLGHQVGIHSIWPTVPAVDERFAPVLSWHNPDPPYMRQPVDGFVNVMEERFSANYRSDSNQHWRSGCPHEALTRSEFPWLQLLVHPEIWVYPGTTMRETMLAMLEAERERRLGQLAEDRIDLR